MAGCLLVDKLNVAGCLLADTLKHGRMFIGRYVEAWLGVYWLIRKVWLDVYWSIR